MSKLAVLKFGGTSVGSAERIKAVAQRIISMKSEFSKIAVVVSAMGKTTDELVRLANEMSHAPDPREYDALVSTGENVSAALLAMHLLSLGQPAISLTGAQAGIKTESLHSKAKILTVDTQRLDQELESGKVVVVTGFQGITPTYDVTTIGRGGSDTSAVVLAAALKVGECHIFTDVDGVYSTDPRRIGNAKKLDEIGYDEMLELASLGAKVLHPRAVECAKENNIVIHVRSSFKPDKGTLVKEISAMEINKPVSGVTINEEEAVISVIGVPDHPGFAGQLFTRLADKGINVDMIIQSVEQDDNNNISFSIHQDDLGKATEITKAFTAEIGRGKVVTDNSIAKISIVGVGMISKPGVAAKMFKALGDAKINIKRISTSEIKISCAIPQQDGQHALEILHQVFELDK